jgi:hypothetical protein
MEEIGRLRFSTIIKENAIPISKESSFCGGKSRTSLLVIDKYGRHDWTRSSAPFRLNRRMAEWTRSRAVSPDGLISSGEIDIPRTLPRDVNQ